MNWGEETPGGQHEPDPLDRLLQSAAWPEPEPERVARLEQRWRWLSRARARRKRRSRAVAWLAVAVGLLAAVALGWRLLRPSGKSEGTAPGWQTVATEQPPPQTAEQEPITQRPQDEPLVNDLPQVRPEKVDSLAPSRPATAYEALVFRSITRNRRLAVQEPADDLLELALRRRLSDSEADLDEVAKPLLAARQSYERALVWQVQDASGPRQVAAIELLGCVGSRQSIPLLIELSRRAPTHAPAMRALARLADPDTLGQLASLETDAKLQQELMAELLGRQDRRSVAAYLTLVSTRSTSQPALAALDCVQSAPAELLFEFFDAPQQRQRVAAAVVLGRLDDPEIPRRLIQMVAHDVRRPEALVALVASSDQEALRFVALAERDPMWMGSVHAARHQVHTMFP